MGSSTRSPLTATFRAGLPAGIALAVLLVVPLVGACNNSCQAICSRMAKRADDCGIEVPKDELKECKAAQAGSASREDRQACREFGDSKEIEERWDCNEVASYWGVSQEDSGTDEATEE